MNKNTRTKTESTTVERLEFPASDLYEKLLPAISADATVRIFMEIPGGADWSNTDLEVDERRCLIVEITTTKREEIES